MTEIEAKTRDVGPLPSEKKAIARLKKGDIGGLETLVRIYQVQATRVAYLIVRDPALAEDIVQSAFVRVYEHIGQFDPARPFAPWFLRIVANDAIKAMRHTGRALPLESDEPEGLSWLDRLPGDVPSPDALVEQAETSRELWELLSTLPLEQRAVIVLHYYAGLRKVEIAGELGIPAGTVRWRLHAALRHLRDRLTGAGVMPNADRLDMSESKKEAVR